MPEGYGFSFVMGTKTYKLYTHSYLGYGLEQAREKLSAELASNRKSVEDPTHAQLGANFGQRFIFNRVRKTGIAGDDKQAFIAEPSRN